MIDKIGYKIRQANLLTHPDFVVLKRHKTHLDILCRRFRLTLSILAIPFYLKRIMQSRVTHMSEPVHRNNIAILNTIEKEWTTMKSKLPVQKERVPNAHKDMKLGQNNANRCLLL